MRTLLEALPATPSLRRAIFAGFGLASVAVVASPGAVAAEEPAACAWPFVFTTEGPGNFLWPDDNARYPFMLFDTEWQKMTVEGVYPEARYMSYTIHYFTNFEATEFGAHLADAQIMPDRGSVNPFVPVEDGARSRWVRERTPTYTLSVVRDGSADESSSEQANVLRVASDPAWLVLRVYLPDMGKNSLGGVPLPTVTVTDWDGATHQLEPCSPINEFDELSQLIPQFFPPEFEIPDIPASPTDRLWLYPISPLPAWLGPNPDNKYVGAFGLDLQPGRVVVIRGQAPGFPNTYFGSPVWEPAPGSDDVQLRYWSLCHNDLVLPLPAVECVADLQTQIDEDGFYTYVLSDHLFAPEWVPADATWLSWGDAFVPKLIAFRNMLPAAGFEQTAQAAIEAGCALPPPFGLPEGPPSAEEVEEAGRCSLDVMGEYYPLATWCDEQLFAEEGWQGCFSAAGIR